MLNITQHSHNTIKHPHLYGINLNDFRTWIIAHSNNKFLLNFLSTILVKFEVYWNSRFFLTTWCFYQFFIISSYMSLSMVVITLLELHSFFETNACPQKEVLSYKKDAPKFIPRLGGLILFNADLIWKWFFNFFFFIKWLLPTIYSIHLIWWHLELLLVDNSFRHLV